MFQKPKIKVSKIHFKYRIAILILALSIINIKAYSQTDTVFWFAVPEVSINNGILLDRPVSLKLSTSNQSATVIVEQPANGGMPTQTINITNNSSYTLDLTPWIDFLENTPADVIHNKGLKITADVPITVYFDNTSYDNPETFVLKGKNALGTEFYIPGQNLFNNIITYTPPPRNSFDIVATEDSTTVIINPINNVVGHNANIPFTITLNKGQTYSATATTHIASQHLTGSHVTSDKPIAITVKDDLLGGTIFVVGCADLTGDQITPVSLQGSEYIAFNNGLLTNTGDLIFLTAIYDNTTFSINNNSIPVILNKGETYQTAISNNYAHIVATHPVYAYQISGRGCELGGAILPQINCTGSNSVSFVRSALSSLYIGLLVESTGISNFTINGNAVNSSLFSAIPSSGNRWYYAIIELPVAIYPQNGVITVSNSSSKFHLSTINDNPGGTSYGYFSDYGNIGAIASVFPNPVCIGESVQFQAHNNPGVNYLWTGPNGFSSTLPNPTITNFQTGNAGTYILNVSGICSNTDSVHISIKPSADVLITTPQAVLCEHDSLSITLEANSSLSNSFSWVGPDGFTANGNQIPLVINKKAQTGRYIVTLEHDGYCKNTDTLYIPYRNAPELKVHNDTSACQGNPIHLYVSGADKYIWSPEQHINNANSPAPVVNPPISTTYFVVGTDSFGCKAMDSVKVTILNVPLLTIATSKEQSNCIVPVQLSASGAANYHWQPEFLFEDPSSSNQIVYVRSTTTFYVTAYNESGCLAKDSITITIEPNKGIFIPNAFTPNADYKNDYFYPVIKCDIVMKTFLVYDRWGNKIFEAKNISDKWNGTYKGKLSELGTYFWLFKGVESNGDEIMLKGDVTLIR